MTHGLSNLQSRKWVSPKDYCETRRMVYAILSYSIRQVRYTPVHPTSSSHIPIEPVHEISNNVACAASKATDQPAHMLSLIRAFASRLIML